uniref:Uncharacterized protein n=1 Tax=Varanus komodoensis TaxID=61221 RepID=A0A8D2IUM0_VARKO
MHTLQESHKYKLDLKPVLLCTPVMKALHSGIIPFPALPSTSINKAGLFLPDWDRVGSVNCSRHTHTQMLTSLLLRAIKLSHRE